MPEQVHSVAVPEHVFAAELRTIEARRKAAGLPSPSAEADRSESGEGAAPGGTDVPTGRSEPGEDATPESAGAPSEGSARPATRLGLIGLAISGGGIRSSTFSVGVLQALAHRGFFKSFDYMSTVSGGGYTGSMLSSLLKDKSSATEGFPLDQPAGEEEPPALRHLRNGSNYLNPGGLLNTLRLPAVVARGLLLNGLLLFPFLILAVLLTELLHEKRFLLLGAANALVSLVRQGTSIVGVDVAVVALLLALFYLFLRGADRGNWARRNTQELAFAVALFTLGVVLILIPMHDVAARAMSTPYADLMATLQSHMRRRVWIVASVILVVAYALVKATEKLDATKKLQALLSKVLLYGVAAAGPGIIFGTYLLLLVAQVDSPFIEVGQPVLEDPLAAESVADGGMIGLDSSLVADLDSKGISYSDPRVGARFCNGNWHFSLPDSTGTGARIPPAEFCGVVNARVQVVSDSIRLADTSFAGVYRMTRTPPSGLYSFELWGAQLHLGGSGSAHTLMDDGLFLWIAIFLLIFNTAFLNVNMSSLHSFYRDRLSRLYIFRQSGTGTAPNDAQSLTGLNQKGSIAPYHIINTTLNLQGDRVESTRGRSSDFFMFSKHYCGGPHTDYCETGDLEALDFRVNLGTAMAISAAAAAPNMGSATNTSMVFVMTLLNFRLGYWLPNPHFVNEFKRKGKRAIPYWTLRPGTLRLADEALGRLTAKTPMVNLSDGGHLENLAAYELLRRRCRLIVILDGEADPDLTFHGLVTLMRLAKIDLGINIHMDSGALEAIQWDEERNTQAHFALGEIDYGEGQTGVLLYVKSSFTGDENPYVKKYRTDNPDFPHETTADQFFDEVQFEAYRALGHHVGHDVADAIRPDLQSFIDAKVAEYEEREPVGYAGWG